jgi:hypothetical protein
LISWYCKEKAVFLMVLTAGIPGAGTPKGSLAATGAVGLGAGVEGFVAVAAGFAPGVAGFAAAVVGLEVVAAGTAAVVVGFAVVVVAGLAAVATAGFVAVVAGVVGACALAATVLAANNRINAECFMA